MQIGNATQVNITNTNFSNLNSGSKLPPDTSKNIDYRQEITGDAESINYDFTNMSRREFSELVKSGEIGFEHFPLVLPEGGIDLTKDTKSQMEAVYDDKIDFIKFIKDRIEYRKSENLPTDVYDKMLSGIEKLKEESKNTTISTYA